MNSADQSEVTTLSVNGAGSESDELPARRRWSAGFWALLKFMGLYFHRTVVPRKKTCFACSVDRFRRRSTAEGRGNMGSYDAEMEPLLIQYEYEDPAGTRGRGYKDPEGVVEERGVSGEDRPLLGREAACPVCETLWWNQDGVEGKYTEGDIGIGWWNHRGSGALSSLLLVCGLALIICDIVNFIDQLWSKPDLILRLMRKSTLYVVLLLYPALSLCSKLRSFLPTSLNNLQWASALNVRYIIRRGQILDIGRKGLPGKMLLLLLLLAPLLAAVYRFLIFTVISQCGFMWSTILTSLVGVISGQWFGLFVYMLYFTRISFQREFDLLLIYFRENEGDQARCRGALFSTFLDFDCFRQLVSLSVCIILPVMVFAVSANLTYEYMFTNTTCIEVYDSDLGVAHQSLRLAWVEIFILFGSYFTAIGGAQPGYIFENFVVRLLHLRSGRHRIFWKNVISDIGYFTKKSHLFLVTTVFSFIGLFMAFNFSNQDVTDLSYCNDTLHEDLCV